MKKLKIAKGGLDHRFKFQAPDGTERHIFQVPHSVERQQQRGDIPAKFVNTKTMEAVKEIIKKHKDKTTPKHGTAYFVTVKNPWVDPRTGRKKWLGFPLQWLNPQGDRDVEPITDENFGKLVTYIEKGKLVTPSKSHGDVPITIATEDGGEITEFITIEVD